jgi:polyisoprenoid-binding protein YceI
MKTALYSIAITVLLSVGYIALHPGVDYVTPRMANAAETPMTEATYSIDPMHASIYFDIEHLGLSRVHGRFNKFSGKIVEDASDLSKCSVNFSAETNSIDTAIEARDNHLRTADFFDVEQFPALTFQSTSVRQVGGGYVVTGDLTMHGVTKQIEIPFAHHGPYTMDQRGQQVTRIGIVADPVTILRSDFGVGQTDPMPDGTMGLSNEVVVRISFEATLDAPPAA